MIRFTKKEQIIRQKAHKHIREYKPKHKKRDIQVTVTTRYGRSIIATFDKLSDAKAYLNKIRKHPQQLKNLGYSNPRIKIRKQ